MYLSLFSVFLLHSFSNSLASSVDFLNEATFQSSILRSPYFVLFYAPWCGHCKRLIASWNELAEKSHESNKRSDVKIAKVNCMEDTILCSAQNILAYPTMKLYRNGAIRRFDGRRSITEFEIFIDKALNNEVDVEQVEGLVTLTTENFDGHIKTGLHFVEFFAPWCVHCQHFAPTWKAVAKHFEKNPDITICKMDCTVDQSKCQELKITGFPMLKLYKDGEEVDNFNAERRMDVLLTYINNNLRHYGLLTDDGDARQEPVEQTNNVVFLTGDEEKIDRANYDDEVAEQDGEDVDLVDLHPVVEIIERSFDALLEETTFVKFYVPWCKYCQQLKPVWESLGKQCQREGGPIIARIDCSKFPAICEKYQVHQYPTLILFKERKRYDYNGERKLESLHKFAKDFHDEL